MTSAAIDRNNYGDASDHLPINAVLQMWSFVLLLQTWLFFPINAVLQLWSIIPFFLLQIVWNFILTSSHLRLGSSSNVIMCSNINAVLQMRPRNSNDIFNELLCCAMFEMFHVNWNKYSGALSFILIKVLHITFTTTPSEKSKAHPTDTDKHSSWRVKIRKCSFSPSLPLSCLAQPLLRTASNTSRISSSSTYSLICTPWGQCATTTTTISSHIPQTRGDPEPYTGRYIGSIQHPPHHPHHNDAQHWLLWRGCVWRPI